MAWAVVALFAAAGALRFIFRRGVRRSEQLHAALGAFCSVMTLDSDTGEYLWHYQTTPGETCDYNSMAIVLADLPINGDTVKALMHAPKNGFFYVIDRRTGKRLSAEPYTEVTRA